MIHTIKINDNTPSGKKLIEELRLHPNSVEFTDTTTNMDAPEGYVIGDEFVKRGKERM